MTLRFEAEVVRCTEALGGDILQVKFDTVDLNGKDHRRSPYVLLGQCFEFPGPPSIEWHDGADYGGGAKIRSVLLQKDSVSISTDRSPGFSISFSVGEARYKELAWFLKRIFPETEVADVPTVDRDLDL